MNDRAATRARWVLEPDMVFLNHGSFGATPKAVLAAQDRWRQRLEAQPCRFVAREQKALIREAADALAAFLGVRGDDLVFVDNATAGMNAVLRSLAFASGDEVVVTDHLYPAVRNTLHHVLAGTGASLRTVELGLPVRSADAITEAVVAALTPRTRFVVLDHVASPSALVLPVQEIATACRAKGVPVVVDGAHGPGLVDLDVAALEVAAYVGNLHKWLCAPKGAGFLWAAPELQMQLHPPVISHAYGEGFTAEFDMVGTRDVSAWLAVPDALAFHAELGGPELRRRNRSIALTGAQRLAARLGTLTGGPDALFAAMVTVRLPWPGAVDRARAEALKARLWGAARIEAQIYAFAEALWLRLSIHAYNDLDDVEQLGAALVELLQQRN
ncbi:MAG: aminotransferase class V-fold PLP-dependent enzyme [Geminicoccaceae bacterium]|nr:MAG: aminotransferase class V-fold PLP-dependent enzyme [Geminicoccaceae bacterium]